MSTKRLPLPKRFSIALSEDAYARLRGLNERYGYSNNYLLTFLLENLDEVSDATKLDIMFQRKVKEFGAPSQGKM